MAHTNPGLRPGLSSAVPAGLDFEMVVFMPGLKPASDRGRAARLNPCPSCRLFRHLLVRQTEGNDVGTHGDRDILLVIEHIGHGRGMR